MAISFSLKNMDIFGGKKLLIKDANLSVSNGDHIFLLGRNGCGKSTFLKELEKKVLSETLWTAYYVTQELSSYTSSIVSIVLASHLERGILWKRLIELEELEEMSIEETAEYNSIGERLKGMKAEADEARAKSILAGLGFSKTDMDRSIEEFSGGWRSRVALAQGLFMEPDLLLLDEPTNHLDLNGVIWLTDFLSKWKKTIIVISHNSGFIDGIANIIWEIRQERLHIYRCTYNRYLQQRSLENKKAEDDWIALEKEVKALRKKGTPAANQAAISLLAKRTAAGICRPEKKYAPKFFFTTIKDKYNGLLISATGANLGYEDKIILRDVEFSIYQGCRIAILGSNGSGKSTLIKFLSGEITAQNEEVAVSRRPGLRVVTFNQHFYHNLPADQTPLEYLKTIRFDEIACRRFLGASGLEGTSHDIPIQYLSGGQKARVYFAGLALQEPDVLLMDEPTNHLDIETINGLITGLQDFGGAVVLISHNIDFLSTLATEVWICESGSVHSLGQGTDGLDIYISAVLDSKE